MSTLNVLTYSGHVYLFCYMLIFWLENNYILPPIFIGLFVSNPFIVCLKTLNMSQDKLVCHNTMVIVLFYYGIILLKEDALKLTLDMNIVLLFRD